VSAFVSGEDVVKIGDLWLRPGFERLGELWKHDPEGIAIEHHGSEAVVRALSEMRARVEPAEAAPVAIGGSVAGDPYVIPTALAGLVLSIAGFASTNLGADLPLAALFAILDRFRPRLVWLSVSVRDLEEGRRAALEDVAATVSERGGTLVVGGRAAPDRVKGATVCRDLATLDAFARGLLA
jgi:methanogenic corrinoid protein MtbC1